MSDVFESIQEEIGWEGERREWMTHLAGHGLGHLVKEEQSNISRRGSQCEWSSLNH